MENIVKIPLFIFIFLLLNSCVYNEKQEVESAYALKSFADNLSSSEKQEILDEAYQKSSNINSDSLREKMLLEISYQFLKLKDSSAFLSSNKDANELAFTLNDSSGIAITFWDLAHFYHQRNIEDSAYYYYNEAQKIYELNGNNLNSAKLLINMAIIQKNVKDFTGSEVTTVQAINVLKPLKLHYQLYRAYNNLGTVFSELEEYSLALQYYGSAAYHLEKSQRNDQFYSLWNNIGVVYHNVENYRKAIEHFEKALNYGDNLSNSDPRMHAMLLDNRAYARLKFGDTTEVQEQLFKALKIREEVGHEAGITINQLHLAEYFLEKHDTISGAGYALAAKELSQNSENMRDLLESLRILSATSDENSLDYAKQYIRINDSLQKIERTTRNKFARIRFETDEYIIETEQLNQRILWITSTAVGGFVILVLLLVIRDQRSKGKLANQKNKANQEIYNLILAQQKNYEEGREKEKQYISRELHDGILGKLFGVRLSLDSLNEEDNQEAKEKRFTYIKEIQKIAEEIRLISHRLRKSSIVDVDFQIVLEELIEKQIQGKVKFNLEMDQAIDWEKVENDVKINLYRILQETINNIHKHAEATKANVQILQKNDLLILNVNDNGKGFNYKETSKGIGLKNIEDRTNSIKGKVSFKSSGKGSFMQLTIPNRF